MPVTPIDSPKQKIAIDDDPLKTVLVYTEGPNYADSFGYQWARFNGNYVDSAIGRNISGSRLELNLGFPLDFLDGMDVLEIGCGNGHFTEHLVKHAAHVTALDYSDAVFHNAALGAPNLTAVRADLLDMPKFSGSFDLVFCRGVIQHTSDPKRSLHALFDHVAPGGLVIFDVYRKNPGYRRTFKYFFRPLLQKHVPLEKFHAFIERHGERLYTQHHRFLRLCRSSRLLQGIANRIPVLSTDWDKEYPTLSQAQRLEVFKNELIDGLYAHYDQPMTFGDVISALAEIGQRPYSYDGLRNHFRCRKSSSTKPLRIHVTKSGVLVDAETES